LKSSFCKKKSPDPALPLNKHPSDLDSYLFLDDFLLEISGKMPPEVAFYQIVPVRLETLTPFLKMAECLQSSLFKWPEQCSSIAACLAFFQLRVAEVVYTIGSQ
jgi:hypothetical protein